MDNCNIVYKKIILARIGEIALKGLNKNKFEAKLINNLKRRLNKIGRFEVTQNQSRIWVECADCDSQSHNLHTREDSANLPPYISENLKQKDSANLQAREDSANLPLKILENQPPKDSANLQTQEDSFDLSAAMNITVKVFGVVSASYAWRFDGDINVINTISKLYVQEILDKRPVNTFKIEARRADKRFPLSSPEICEEVGAYILQEFPFLKVQVKNPDLVLNVEIREHIYIHSGKIMGFRGLPVGTAGKGLLLLSGGIDSPVAGFMMASRGMEIEAVYFHSFPYTSDRAKEKVIELAGILSDFTGRLRLHIVDFTSIQLELRDKSPNEMITVTMRRIMMRIAEKIAKDIGAAALITGESLGQVASQTLEAINCTDSVVSMPVFRPLIGMDKDDTILIARKIGTFGTSILPYEDCCTVFVAKHPKTHPSLETAEKCEKNLDIEELVLRGVSQVEILIL